MKEPAERAGAPVAYIIAGGIVLISVVATCALWSESPNILKHVTNVAAALSPIFTFLTVVVAATGWVVSARLSGEEARRTERAKQAVADAAHRDFVRARLERVWGIIDEAVGIKPYQPLVVERFIAETEDLYWKPETFQPFTQPEHNLIRLALDRARLDNALTSNAITDEQLAQTGRTRTDVIREYFIESLRTLETLFRDVFNDAALTDTIARSRARSEEWVELTRQHMQRRLGGA